MATEKVEDRGGTGLMGLLIFGPLKLIWWSLVIATPVLGVWVGSSLAAYLNGPRWLVMLAGALLFPVLPLGWEWLSWTRKKRKAREKEREYTPMLSFWDRSVLRTLLINVVFLGALFAYFPKESFVALSARGDWPLDGQEFEQADDARAVMLEGAGRLEWLYELANNNAYEEYAGAQSEVEAPSAGEVARVDITEGGGEGAAIEGKAGVPKAEGSASPSGGEKKPDEKPVKTGSRIVIEDSGARLPTGSGTGSGTGKSTPARKPGQPPSWPMSATLHPVVAQMPSHAETNIESVARYITEREDDPFLKVKALHDYVADRIAYDVVSLRSGNFAPQNAEAVFRARKGVCAGYATLLAELGRHAGVEIVVLTGDSKSGIMSGDSMGHAWSAAKIDGGWYLMDATWNAGSVDGPTFTKKYGTDYLFTPPEVFGLSHLPKDDKWQLRAEPLSRAEFTRGPELRPSFYGHGLELVTPQRAQFDATGTATITLKNPRQKALSARIVKDDSGGKGERCEKTDGIDVTISCPLSLSGTYRIVLFAGEYNATLWGVANFTVHSKR